MAEIVEHQRQMGESAHLPNLTLSNYLLLAFFTYLQVILGPVMLFLRLAVAVGVAQGNTDVASARVTLGAGLAILTAPLALGRFADEIGIADAYGVTLLLIVGGLAMVLLANRLETRLTPGARSVGDDRVRRPGP